MRSRDSEAEILLAEDDTRDAALAARVLSHYDLARSLYRVRDGQEVLDYVFARGFYAYRNRLPAPRFILLDLRLPRIHGLEVLRQLKSSESARRIPVIVTTGSSAEADRLAGSGCGADGHILKPMEAEQFERALCEAGCYSMAFNMAIV